MTGLVQCSPFSSLGVSDDAIVIGCLLANKYALVLNNYLHLFVYSHQVSTMATTSSGVYDFYAEDPSSEQWKCLLQPALRKVCLWGTCLIEEEGEGGGGLSKWPEPQLK